MKDEGERRVGKEVRIILVGQIFYHGKIIFEDKDFIVIKDKFTKEVSLSKPQILSVEVMENEWNTN